MPEPLLRGNRLDFIAPDGSSCRELRVNWPVGYHSAGRSLPERRRVQPDWISGQNKAMSPRAMIVLTRLLEKKTPSPPCEARSDCRNASSALSPSTIASTIGAIG